MGCKDKHSSCLLQILFTRAVFSVLKCWLDEHSTEIKVENFRSRTNRASARCLGSRIHGGPTSQLVFIIYLFAPECSIEIQHLLPSRPGVFGPKGPKQTFRGLVEPIAHWVKVILGRWLVQTDPCFATETCMLIYEFMTSQRFSESI